MSDCDHRFQRAGVVYEVSAYPIPGSGAREVAYFDHYFCERCLEHRYERLPGRSDTYQEIRFGATPRQTP